MSSQDHALQRIGPVDQIDHRLPLLFHPVDVLRRNVAGLPTAEPLLQLGSDFLQHGVANNDECGLVRLEPGVVELLHVGTFSKKSVRSSWTISVKPFFKTNFLKGMSILTS